MRYWHKGDKVFTDEWKTHCPCLQPSRPYTSQRLPHGNHLYPSPAFHTLEIDSLTQSYEGHQEPITSPLLRDRFESLTEGAQNIMKKQEMRGLHCAHIEGGHVKTLLANLPKFSAIISGKSKGLHPISISPFSCFENVITISRTANGHEQ